MPAAARGMKANGIRSGRKWKVMSRTTQEWNDAEASCTFKIGGPVEALCHESAWKEIEAKTTGLASNWKENLRSPSCVRHFSVDTFGGQRAADVQHKQPTDPPRVCGSSRVHAVIVMTRSAAATTVKAVTCPKEDKRPRRSCRDNRTQPMFECRHLVYPALA